MSTSRKSDPESVTTNIELATADWSLQTTVSVPAAPMPAKELLPLAQGLADVVVKAAIESVEDTGKQISCRKGCGACCRQLVPISEIEARDIRDLINELPEPRRTEIRRRFAQARQKLEESGLLGDLSKSDQWSEAEVQSLGLKYFYQGIPCPFLEKESCSIHPRRPISCREYLVTSPAENCANPDQKSVEIELVNVPIKIWPALARLDDPSPGSRFIRWVPLILAPEWVESHPAEPSERPGPEWLRELFNNLTGEKTEPLRTAQDSLAAFSDSSRQQPAPGGEAVKPSVTAVEASSPNQAFPLRIGSADDFAHVESMLRAACFDEETVCRVLGIADMSDVGSIRRDRFNLSGYLGLLIRLFLFLESIPRHEVERWIAPDSLRHLLALDLLRRAANVSQAHDSSEIYHSPVWLYPVTDLIIATDRGRNPDGSELTTMPDIVFPAIYEGTLRFLRVISKTPAADALDLCSGSGVAALALSKTVDQVIACDITSRASHFAEFNRRLNRASNVEIVQGDLYSAVQGKQFDRIVAHPPFVPASSEALIYRDSGTTGESLIRRIVAGLPAHLRPGGTFCSVCAAWDSKEAPFEERARDWLGIDHEEFDMLFALHRQRSPEEVAERVVALNHLEKGEIRHWTDRFRAARFERNVYGAIIIQRRKPPFDERHPFTRRVRLGDHTSGNSFEWALHWYSWRADIEARGDFAQMISRLTPRLSPHLKAQVIYSVQDETLAAREAVLETLEPFLAESKIDLWMMQMISEFDGKRTPEVVYESARKSLPLPETFGLADFANLVGNLIERGYLEIEGRVLDG
jgi:Fe-S-cluster containining protein/SAM-dependent methyltransferase